MTESSEQGQSSSEQDRQDIRVERGDGVVEVTFDRPHRHNAFTREMYAQMRELCAELAEDPQTRVLVLRGAGGRAFAAGNEISDFLEQDAVAYEDWIRELLESLFALPQVTVAAVDGVCVGGGLAVATHCDLRIATPGSRFGYPIARTLGNALAGSIVYRCASVFGESLTREMLLASRLVDAPRAHAVSLAARGKREPAPGKAHVATSMPCSKIRGVPVLTSCLGWGLWHRAEAGGSGPLKLSFLPRGGDLRPPGGGSRDDERAGAGGSDHADGGGYQ